MAKKKTDPFDMTLKVGEVYDLDGVECKLVALNVPTGFIKMLEALGHPVQAYLQNSMYAILEGDLDGAMTTDAPTIRKLKEEFETLSDP